MISRLSNWLCGLVTCILIWPGSGLAQSPLDGDPLDRLNAQRYGPGTLIAAMEELEVYRPDQAVEPVRLLLVHPDPDVARTAGWLLRRMEAASASIGGVAAVLADPAAEAGARSSAALALGELRSSGSLDPLIQALSADAEVEVRTKAALSLGALHRAGAATALTNALASDGEPAVRQAAARALAQVPDVNAGALINALSDNEALVRMEAAWSLGRLRSSNAVGNLVGHLQTDPDCPVRAASAWALGRIGDSTAQDALRQARTSDCRLAAQAASHALAQL